MSHKIKLNRAKKSTVINKKDALQSITIKDPIVESAPVEVVDVVAVPVATNFEKSQKLATKLYGFSIKQARGNEGVKDYIQRHQAVNMDTLEAVLIEAGLQVVKTKGKLLAYDTTKQKKVVSYSDTAKTICINLERGLPF